MTRHANATQVDVTIQYELQTLSDAPSRIMESAVMCHPSQHESANEALV